MFVSAGLFLFTLFFYLRTICASFNINDSGETIMDCDLLAIAHSPGYPLHTLWGRLFCLLPLGQPMFRLTFASSLMGAFSVTVLYVLLKKTLQRSSRPENLPGAWITEVSALFGALTFAFSFQQWFQACGAKGSIYTLNTLLAVVTLYFLLKIREDGWFTRGLWLATFFLALGLSVHWETQVVLLPAYAWFLITAQNRIRLVEIFRNLLRPFDLWAGVRRLTGAFGGKTGLVRMLTFILLPLSTYLYLPIRAHGGPVLNWWDPGNLQRFLTVVLRGNYAGTGDSRSLTTVHRNLDRFWLHAHDQYGVFFTAVLFLLAVTGLVWLFRNQRVHAIGFLFFGGGVFSGVIFYNAPLEGYQWTLDNFFTPVFLTFCFFAAAGLSFFLRWIPEGDFPRSAAVGLSTACLGLALFPLGLNYDTNDQSTYTVSYEEGLNMLKTVGRDGVILCNGDIDILPLWYLQLVEGKRPQVASLTTQLAGLQWYREDLARQWPFLQTSIQGDVRPDVAVETMIHSHSSDHPFYVTNIFPQGAAWLWKSHVLAPDGMLWRLADTHGQDFAFTSRRVNGLWSGYKLRNLDPPERKYWDDYTDVMKDAYGQACSFTGDFAMAHQDPQLAQWSYTKALQYHQPQVLGITYLKLADSELALGRPVDAVSHYQQSIQREPRGLSQPYVYAPYAYARLGDAFLMEKDLDDAEAAFRFSLRINPQQEEALDGLRQLDKVRDESNRRS